MNFSLFSKKPTKKEKISKAQESTLLLVGATSIVVGASIVMITNLNKYISFNNKVIDAKNGAINNYSVVIEESGACEKPKNSNGIYTANELRKCSPDDIDYKDVPDSLRSNILTDAAARVSFESIARTSVYACINPETNKQYSHDELEKMYEYAETSNEKRTYLNMIKACSALRVVPDALPSVENKEALLASLNKIYILSGIQPDSLAPNSNQGDTDTVGYSSIPVSLSMSEDADLQDIITFLKNLSKSIRYFSITSLHYDTDDDEVTANAEAYYVNSVESTEKTVTMNLKDNN